MSWFEHDPNDHISGLVYRIKITEYHYSKNKNVGLFFFIITISDKGLG